MKRKKDMVSASEYFITDTTLCTICSCPYNMPPFDDWTQCTKCTSWYLFSCGLARCLLAQLLVFLNLKFITTNRVVILSHQCLLL